eukprot:3385829-Alexandrium_andersonii.AAC.1
MGLARLGAEGAPGLRRSSASGGRCQCGRSGWSPPGGRRGSLPVVCPAGGLSLIHISEPTRLALI